MKQVTQSIKEIPVRMEYIEVITYTCDWCAKEVCDHGEPLIGGNHNGGWYHVSRTSKSTALEELKKKSEWDFCCLGCLSLWVNDSQTRWNA